MVSRTRLTLIIIMLVLLAGCRPPPPPRVPMRDPALAKLAEAATSIDHSLVQLAKIEQAASPPLRIAPPPDPKMYGMAHKASIDWTGPIESLVEEIGKATSYHVKVLGHRPAIPIIVAIQVKNVPLGDVLRDAGYQCGTAADIVVFPSIHLIELRYSNENI